MNQTQIDPNKIIDDITAACNSIGQSDENDGTYMKDRDCKACLKEIMRSLNADSAQHVARTTIGALNIIKSDLIPLINQYCDYNDGDLDLFGILLRLSTNLTSSPLLLFQKQEVPEEQELALVYRKLLSHLYGYKVAFANDQQIWNTLNVHLKHTEDEVTFERLIVLIRNVLHIPVDSSRDLGVHDDLDAHEMCINQMDKSGMFGTIIKIASDTERGTEFCFHITEIIYLILRDKNPATIATAMSNSNKRKLDDEDPQKKLYLELSERNRREREASKLTMTALTSSSRFRNSAFLVKNIRTIADKPMVVRRPIKSREEIELDRGKNDVRKSKLKKPHSSETSAIGISIRNTIPSRNANILKAFCIEFVEKIYANYMQHIKHNLIQKKAAENDETYYLWAVQFFSAFNRLLFLTVDNIAETLSTSTIHFIQILITSYHDKLKIEKNKPLKERISRRLHLGIRAYKEILLLLKSIQKDSEYWQTCEKIKKNIYTDKDYNCLLLNSFQEYDEPNYCREFLEDLIMTNDIFLDSIEEFGPEHFTSRYCNPHVIKSYVDILKSFQTNSKEINLALLRFLKRVVFECHQEVILMQVSIFKCLLKIMDYKYMPEHEEFVKLGQHLICEFARLASKKRWMFQEILFYKTMGDVVEIENAIDPPKVAEKAANDDEEDPLAALDDLFENKLDEQSGEANVDTQEDQEKQDRSQSLDDLLAELGSDTSSNHSAGSRQSKHSEPKEDFNLGISSDDDDDVDDDKPQQVSFERTRLLSSSSSSASSVADVNETPRPDKPNAFTINDDDDDNDDDDESRVDDNENDNHVQHPASDGSSLSDFPDVSEDETSD